MPSRPVIRFLGIPVLQLPGKREWRTGTLLFVAYLAATRISSALAVAPAVVFPAAGIAIGGLFLEGVYLWPFIYAAAAAGYVLNGSTLVTILIMPMAHTLQAVAGALLLKRLRVDPILRRSRDMFAVIFVSLTISAIVPTLGQVVRALNQHFFNVVPSATTWTSWWTGLTLSLLILTPFVLRWFAKPHFTRSLKASLEIGAALGALVVLAYLFFWSGVSAVGGISLAYMILVPLFWIALRIGPRFLTLALLLLTCIALSGTFLAPVASDAPALGARLIQTELFLIIVAIVFFVIVTIEEERRMATKLLNSQIRTLRSTLDELAGKDKAKNDFIATLAHELRNPLASVMNAAEILRHTIKDAREEQTAAVRLIGERMQMVGRLLEDLLDVARIAERKLIMKKEAADLRDIASRAAAGCEHALSEREQRLITRLPEKSLPVHADTIRIEQVIANLIMNASKYSPRGAEISLEARPEGRLALVRVKDQGVGIAPDMLPRIFEPFQQIEQGSSTRKGLGIGLALVKSLVEMHEGRITAKSEGPGKGSEFTVGLPIERAAVVSPTRFRPEDPDEQDAGGRACSVLVVDDEDAAAWSVGKLLELKGYEVAYAYDGTHAIEKVIQEAPDAVLLDVALPDADGFTVARSLREAGYAGNLIALTGFSDDEARAKAHAAGFDHYLVKPVGIADLRRVLPRPTSS